MILVVDDDHHFLIAADRLFGGLTLPAVSVTMGLYVARRTKLNAIVLDVHFPGYGHSGIDAVPGFRRFAEHAPIVVVSADYSREDAITALSSGCYGYVEKGDPGQLLAVVNAAVTAGRESALLARLAGERRPPLRAPCRDEAPPVRHRRRQH